MDIIRSNGLVVSALCGDFGQGFGDSEKNPELIERSKRVLDLAKDLETDVVTTHIGVVPEDDALPLALNRGVPLLLASRGGAAGAYRNIAIRLQGGRAPLLRIR